MTLNHSKTWPVSTLAVVQLRVDPNGRTYSTQFDGDLRPDEVTDFEIQRPINGDIAEESHVADGGNSEETNPLRAGTRCENNTGNEQNAPIVLPLSQRHVQLFTVQQQQQQQQQKSCNNPSRIPRHPYKTTVRTDTVSTILEQDNDIDTLTSTSPQHLECGGSDKYESYEKFHVLALTKIEECVENDPRSKLPSAVHVENWQLPDEQHWRNTNTRGGKLCPACSAAAAAAAASTVSQQPPPSNANYKQTKHSPSDYNERLLVDLPLDARKATTLRRHYYPEGGWGWVIIACTVLVHVLNVGMQLSCSQLAPFGAEKFKTTPVHIAGQWNNS